MKRLIFLAFLITIISLAAVACQPATLLPSITPDTVPPTPSNLEVTLTDQGKSISLHSGETFLLKLGDMYDWTISIDNQSVISRVKNIAVVRGAQGVYQVLAVGETLLSAVGNPQCYSSKPPCLALSIMFQITVQVVP